MVSDILPQFGLDPLHKGPRNFLSLAGELNLPPLICVLVRGELHADRLAFLGTLDTTALDTRAGAQRLSLDAADLMRAGMKGPGMSTPSA